MMGNDHILSLRTGDALVQRRAPALGRRIYVSGLVGDGRVCAAHGESPPLAQRATADCGAFVLLVPLLPPSRAMVAA